MTARKSFVLAPDLDGLHSEQTLPLTKAHVSSVGAVVGPTSAPFSAAVEVTSSDNLHPSPAHALAAECWQLMTLVWFPVSLFHGRSHNLPHPESRFAAAHSADSPCMQTIFGGQCSLWPKGKQCL